MAIIGVGAKLEYQSGSSWTEVLNCKSVNFPAFNITSVETTSLSSPDYAKEFMPGMIDADSITADIEYSTATYVELTGLLREVVGWRVSSPVAEGDVVTCDGFITAINTPMSPDEEVMISVTIKMTGKPVVS